MGEMGNGYGSECHLLRFMGRHRHLLDERILAVLGGDSINWLDFGFDSNTNCLFKRHKSGVERRLSSCER